MADPKKINLHVSSVKDQALEIQSLPSETQDRLHQKLRENLAKELAATADTLGLKPGDTVAISSSVGQSISF
jgi:hypothetical protein